MDGDNFAVCWQAAYAVSVRRQASKSLGNALHEREPGVVKMVGRLDWVEQPLINMPALSIQILCFCRALSRRSSFSARRTGGGVLRRMAL